jgi:hypothetical protein
MQIDSRKFYVQTIEHKNLFCQNQHKFLKKFIKHVYSFHQKEIANKLCIYFQSIFMIWGYFEVVFIDTWILKFYIQKYKKFLLYCKE